MELMGAVFSRTPLERLPFNNVVMRALPLDSSNEPGSRTVKGACFSRVSPQPLTNPRFVAVSEPGLSLLGLSVDDVLSDPHGPQYLSGSKRMPGSEPAAHCYCGHQFGQFAGQLGDGAVCYLGEVDSRQQISHDNPCGRWEIQVKGAGKTPYSRQSDGRKVLRSSIREFLCSEAMFALGVPTTRAGSLVTSDTYVTRDVFYSGNSRPERCSVVLRIAPTFLRFGSFEIFLPPDDFTGRKGPSAGQYELRGQLLDYIIQTFYPDIQKRHSDRKERNAAFFQEVAVRTAKLVALWQSVGFCHGVLNTDNMSILGLTIDYGPFGFMDRFDPEFACNGSDRKRRYTYEAQPYVCRWNLVRLAEALGKELAGAQAGAILDDYMPTYERFYLGNMRRKLGLLERQEPEDQELVADLLDMMYYTGADFTNTFRLLSQVPWPVDGCQQEEEEEDEEEEEEGEEDEEDAKEVEDQATMELERVVALLLEQASPLEELKVAHYPTMEPRELEMLLSMSETDPGMFGIMATKPEVSKQLVKLGRLKQLLETTQEELTAKQTGDWLRWIQRYRRRLARECEEGCDKATVERLKTRRIEIMDNTNPRFVLRNYIAQNAIEAAEKGDFSEVQRVLKLLEKPYAAQPGLERPSWMGRGPKETPCGLGGCGPGGSKVKFKDNDNNGHDTDTDTDTDTPCLPYDSKPPTWAREICVT